jgi:hypothetical protein
VEDGSPFLLIEIEAAKDPEAFIVDFTACSREIATQISGDALRWLTISYSLV